MSDYLELGHFDDDTTVTVHVMGAESYRTVAALKSVDAPLVRYNGYWTIPCKYVGAPATAWIPADQVGWFLVFEEEHKDWQEIVDSEERDADGNFLSLHTVTLNPEPR